MPYDAFISYSHAADGKMAPAVQSALHKLAKPWYRMRALTVFRDETSLSAEYDLTNAIRQALSTARYFVLMASPDAARSIWVGREIELWRARGLPRQLLIVLTEGDIVWDTAARDFDWARSTGLHPALKGMFEAEPLWVDLRWARDDQHFSARDARFQRGIARIAAPMHGKSLDEMFGEDVRQHRITQRVMRTAIATLTALLILSGLTTFLATEANRRLDTKIGLLSSLLPAFGSGSWEQRRYTTDKSLVEQAWGSLMHFLFLADDGEEAMVWEEPAKALAEDCAPDKRQPIDPDRPGDGCPASNAVFAADGLRTDVPGLREMSTAVVEAMRDGTMRKLLLHSISDALTIPGEVDLKDNDIWILAALVLMGGVESIVPTATYKTAVEAFIEGDPNKEAFERAAKFEPLPTTRYFLRWRKMLQGAELIALRLMDSGACGSGGCRNPILFFLRVGDRYRLVLVDSDASQVALYNSGRGLMPQIFAINIKQAGAGEQFRTLRRYDFNGSDGHYEPYLHGSIHSLSRGFERAIPSRLD